jgi:hypothetical protein
MPFIDDFDEPYITTEEDLYDVLYSDADTDSDE